MSAKSIPIAHPVTMKDALVGLVTHENVPPGTVIIWPQSGADPVVMDVDQLSGKLTTELSKVTTPHPLTSPPPPHQYGLKQIANPYKGSFLAAVKAEMAHVEKQMVEQMKNGTPTVTVVPPPEPTTELIDSSNPFAKALDAWQTGKAEWAKGSLYQAATEGEPA